MENINRLLEDIKEFTGITEFKHHSIPEKNFDVWVSEPDDIKAYLMVDKSGNISMYEKISGDIDKIYLSVNTFEDFKKDYAPVRMMIMIENHLDLVEDNKIRTDAELLEWIEENDMLNLLPAEAKSVMEYYQMAGYELYCDGEKLFESKDGKAMLICIDDVIAAAAEQVYEHLHQLDEEIYQMATDKEKSQTFDDFVKMMDKTTERHSTKMSQGDIMKACAKTIYGKRLYYDALYASVTEKMPRRPKSR